ncbi:MAG: LytTR family transcriptional regulator DNA-binding domain-containing protein, partial [Haliscomenobacter sp.]
MHYKHKDEPKYILKRDRLKNVYTRLQKHHFVQTHKSYLVNLAMIKQV